MRTVLVRTACSRARGAPAAVLAAALLGLCACSEEERPVPAPSEPDTELEATPPPPPAGRVVWIEPGGAIKTSPAEGGEPSAFAPPVLGANRIHAVLSADRVVAGAHEGPEASLGPASDARNEIFVVDRGRLAVRAGTGRRAFAAPGGRFVVIEESRTRFDAGGLTTEHTLHAFDVETGQTRAFGSGRFLAFDERGRAIGQVITTRRGANDGVIGASASLTAASLPGAPRAGAAPEEVPFVGPRGTVAWITAPSALSLGSCVLRAGEARWDLRGAVCDQLAPIAWAPDESAIAFLVDQRDRAELRVVARDGAVLGRYEAGVAARHPRTSQPRIVFAPDGSELALERPDRTVVRVARDGTLRGEHGAGSLRGYDASGRYLLIVAGEPPRARVIELASGSARELGPALDAAWLPPHDTSPARR